MHHNHHHHIYDHHCHNLPFLRLPSYKFKRSFIHLSTDSKTPLRDMKPYAPASIPVDDNNELLVSLSILLLHTYRISKLTVFLTGCLDKVVRA
jgi:hypothetical protein